VATADAVISHPLVQKIRQVTTMLGFCGCCAAAGALTTVAAATNANEPSKMFLILFMA
jgi:hypothetical protein